MKKGFTLIELLAVILILGIIALIAIPTVNNIILEARYGAFKSSSDNIMKSIQQECQTSLLRGENPVLSYIFEEGKISSEINIKGSIPKDGYILLNKECEINDYYLSDNKNIYSNNEDVRQDYMLKESLENNISIFQTLYPDYYNQIISINFINNLDIPENAIEIKDPSVSEKGKIKSWLNPNGEYYDLYIGSEKKIYSNYNSSYLFINSISKNIFLDNFNTSFTTSMYKMFFSNKNLENINVSNFDVSNVTEMVYMFAVCENIKSIDISKWNARKLLSPQCLFEACSLLETIILPKNFITNKVKNIAYMFSRCKKLKNIDVSDWDTSNVTSMAYLFNGCNELESINTKNWEANKLVTISYIFQNCYKLKLLDLSNWNIPTSCSVVDIFTGSENLINLKLSNATTANLLINLLPVRTSKESGFITIIGDKNGLDTNSLIDKNWNIL